MVFLGARRNHDFPFFYPSVRREQKVSFKRINKVYEFYRPDLSGPPKLSRRDLAPHRGATRAKHVQRVAPILQSVLGVVRLSSWKRRNRSLNFFQTIIQ